MEQNERHNFMDDMEVIQDLVFQVVDQIAVMRAALLEQSIRDAAIERSHTTT